MCHVFNESAIPVNLLTFIKLSFNKTLGNFRIRKNLICCLYILSWKVKLFHRHCLKPCSKICHWESSVSSLRIQTEWKNSRSHNVDEYTLSGNINTVKKNTVNILVHIEELGLEWNTGKYKCIFSFVKIIQKNYIPKGLCIS